MNPFFNDDALDWLRPEEIHEEEESPFPKHKEKEKKEDLCGKCIEEGEEKACKNCQCSNCHPDGNLDGMLEELDHMIGRAQDRLANPNITDYERDDVENKLDKWKKQRQIFRKKKGCPCRQRGNTFHPCHRNFSSNCFFAYYKAYSVAKNKKAEIHFVQPNLLSTYFEISSSYRGNYNELWPIMVTGTFYHELGHHLVQLYVDELTHSNYSKRSKRLYISETDEQKLCEYIGFKKTLELLKQSPLTPTLTIPEKYKKKTTRGSKKNNMNKHDYDIGNSGIYHKLPLYTTQPFSASFRQTNIGILPPENPVEYISNHKDYSPTVLLSAIAKAKGGRGREDGPEGGKGRFYPEITKATRDFIKINEQSWDNLFNIIINLGKGTFPQNVPKNIITKNNIVTCSKKPCKFPLNNKTIADQSKISFQEELNGWKPDMWKFIGYERKEEKKNYIWLKGRTLDILQKEGYTHQEYRKIRNDSNLKNIPKPDSPAKQRSDAEKMSKRKTMMADVRLF